MLLNTNELLALFDADQRYQADNPSTLREETPETVRFFTHDGQHAFITYSRLTEQNADSVIAREVERVRGLECEWKLYTHDHPADLGARLAAHGFQAEEPETVVVLDLAQLPAVLRHPPAHTIRPITDEDGIRELVQIENTVWGDDHAWLGEELLAELQQPGERLLIFLAECDGVPAATAWIRFRPESRFASLWGGSTLPEFRKRGLYTALLAVRAQAAIRRGVDFLTVDAGPMSRPILERLGFVALTGTQPYILKP
jgi:GNAT superfamily N-acetyltransferase